MIRLSIALAFALIVPAAAQAEGGGLAVHLGPHFCLRSVVCGDQCPTKFDARCSPACKSSLALCQAHRAKDELLFRAALVGLASAKFLRGYENQHRISEAPQMTTVGMLLKECESQQPLEREECVNVVGAWGSIMTRNGRERKTGAKVRRPGAACAIPPVSDAEFAQAFIEWARQYPSERDLDVHAGLDFAIAAAWPCPGASTE